MTLHPAIQPDDDFLLDDGLPCLRRTGKLYYLGDMQPRVLEACRRVDISFDQLAEKLGIARPMLLLILKGYDPVPVPLKSMIDRLVSQVGLMQPATSYCDIPAEYVAANESAAPAAPTPTAPPISTTIHSIPVPEVPVAEDDDLPPITVAAEEVPADDMPDEVIIPQVLALDRPAAARPAATRAVAVPPAPPSFAATLAGFTPGLKRAPRSRASREQL